MLLESLLYRMVMSHWAAMGVLATLALPGALLVARWFPETAACLGFFAHPSKKVYFSNTPPVMTSSHSA
jgi:hypothetical protein